MDFFLVGFGLWGLILLSAILLIIGLWKKSWLSLFFSGLTLLLPAVILSTQRGWFTFFIFIPLIIFWVAEFTRESEYC